MKHTRRLAVLVAAATLSACASARPHPGSAVRRVERPAHASASPAGASTSASGARTPDPGVAAPRRHEGATAIVLPTGLRTVVNDGPVHFTFFIDSNDVEPVEDPPNAFRVGAAAITIDLSDVTITNPAARPTREQLLKDYVADRAMRFSGPNAQAVMAIVDAPATRDVDYVTGFFQLPSSEYAAYAAAVIDSKIVGLLSGTVDRDEAATRATELLQDLSSLEVSRTWIDPAEFTRGAGGRGSRSIEWR